MSPTSVCRAAEASLLALCVANAVQAQEAQDAQQAPVEGVAQVMTNQLGALTRASPRGKLEPVEVSFRGTAVRIEFRDSRGNPYAMLLPEAGQAAWILDGTGAMPVPGQQLSVLMDPVNPCAGKGMFADCKRLGEGTYAGRQGVHWRYRFSNAIGPGLTRRGDVWLDADTGLVLGYAGDNGMGRPQEWQVQSVDYGPVDDALFEVPEAAVKGRPSLKR